MEINARELRARRADLVNEAEALVKGAELQDRDLTADEQKQFDDNLYEAAMLEGRAKRLEDLTGIRGMLATGKAAAVNKIPGGSTEAGALVHFIRSGDGGALREYRASNDTDMNIGTSADGGYAVPTGHYGQIIARRDEDLLAAKLGIMNLGGEGTTLNVPLDGEADGEFVVTTEASDHDRDAPAIGTKALTLARYTKKIQISWELLWDEKSNLLAFLENFVGRGMAKTHNNLLLTEVAANGTALKTFASATVIAVDEPEAIVFNNDLSAYLDDSRSVAWVMQPAVHGELVLLDDSSIRRYAQNSQPDGTGRNLLGYPIHYSQKAGATAASAKSLFFGNWAYVGWRTAPSMDFIRDPYSYEGGIELRYQFRTVYGVLQAEAIGYGVHPSA